MSKKFLFHPAHPERMCWGCDRHCPADAMVCSKGSVATLDPAESFGEDWMSIGKVWQVPSPANSADKTWIEPAAKV